MTVKKRRTPNEALIEAVDALSKNLAKWMAKQDATTAMQSAKIEAGFALVAEAIAHINPPQPPRPEEGGILLSRYRIAEDQPAINFELVGTGFKSSKGTETGAGDIDLSVQSNSPGLTASLGTQTVSEDGKTVKATVTLTANSPTVDMAVVSYKATNRDTGNVVAADSDEFIIGPGEASIGTLNSPVPLDEVEM